ncbi:MAG TPA: DNA-binding domain-containing protein [Verrucomicrobiae bacterium]|nr:DNA-binding domain-containing protein [Verrucomicrobiae bacterium]
MNLATLQKQVARAVMTPLTPAERMRRSNSPVAKKIIKPNDRLTSFERLEIYNRQYWFRVLDGFSDDFPGLRAVLGDRAFDSLAKHYLTACPSRSFTMRDLGSRLETWLRKHPSYARGRFRLGLDMVRLEWAEIETFDGASHAPINKAKLAGADPTKLRLRLQPYIRLLDLRYPVDDLLLAVKHDAPPDMASNAMEERQKRKKVAAVARLKPVPVYLAIHRVDNMVYFRHLDREEFTILQSLQKGRTLERAIVAGFRSSKIPPAERAPRVAAWFQNWSSLGWFVS